MRITIAAIISSIALTSCSNEADVSTNDKRKEPALSVASVDLSPKEGTSRWYSQAQLSEGNEIYAENCASCHGKQAESIASWQQIDANGIYPPPPLNGSAHAWHHSLDIMDRVIREGGKPLGGVMPGWKDILTEDQRLKAVASFQQYWSDDIYARWLERERLSR